MCRVNGKTAVLKSLFDKVADYKLQTELPKKTSKKSGLTGPQFLEWGCWKKGDDLFQSAAIFT